MTRFCANCGTEVDETAAFCPTCGQAIDPASEPDMPPAPTWPDPEPGVARPTWENAAVEPEPPAEPREWDDEAPSPDEPAVATRVEPRPATDAPPARSEPSKPAIDLPLTMPVTLSAWLIGGGAVVAAVGALIAAFDGLGTLIDILLLVTLLAVAATVFLSDRLPHIPHLRLATLAIVLVAFGVSLDRLSFGRAGAGELLLLLGTAAAAMGAILLETGRDQPLGGPSA